MEPLHILNLPEDILYEIFNHFHCDKIHRGLFDATIHNDWTKLQTVKAARLVCHTFNRLASPLLCPTLRVRLDHVSLDFVAKVAENPLTAKGVHNIEVVVDYYPRELATDLLRFGQRRRNDLIHRVRECCRYEMIEIEANDMDHETVSDYPYKDYQQTMEYCQNIIAAWNKYTRLADKGDMDATSLGFILLFRQGHQEYIQKHEEQFQLITDGSFVDRLTSAMSRMRHCVSLQFVDDIDCYSMLENASPLTFRDDARQLSRLMTSPLS